MPATHTQANEPKADSTSSWTALLLPCSELERITGTVQRRWRGNETDVA